MRIFLYEHVSACGRRSMSEDDALFAEGWAMFSALRHDLARIDGVEVVALPHSAGGSPSAFRELSGTADYTIVIAPEAGGELLRRGEWVRQAGGRLLSPEPEAVALTADKFSTWQHLEQHGVPTPPTWLLASKTQSAPPFLPCVVKPRFGAGSQNTFLVGDLRSWESAFHTARTSQGEFVIQPFMAGLAASVAFFVGPQETRALLPARQILSGNGRFHYEGGEIPLPAKLAERAEELGRRTLSVLAGLRGYVGVDLVLSEEPKGDSVIEINPRLTTSYVGLRALAEANLAEVMLRLAQAIPVPPLNWRPGRVRFRPTGTVEYAGD